VQAIVHNYYKVEKEGSRDPIIHFMKIFCRNMIPLNVKKWEFFIRRFRVVQFIVRSVDDIFEKKNLICRKVWPIPQN